MQVWIIHQHAGAPDQPGHTRHWALARQLRGKGHGVTIIAGDFNNSDRRSRRLTGDERSRLEEVQGVSYLWLGARGYRENGWDRVRGMLEFALRLRDEPRLREIPAPDVIVGSSPSPLAAFAAERLARRRGVPFVFEVRDLYPLTLVELGAVSRHNPLAWLLRSLEKHLCRRAAAVVSVLPKAGPYLAASGARSEGIFHVPNGIDRGQMPPHSPPPRELPFVVMYAGNHGVSNDLETLLQASLKLQQLGWGDRIRFRLLGDGPRKAALIDLAVRLKTQLVDFLPAVPRGEVQQLLRDAGALVALTRDSALYDHGISFNKLPDYFAAGRPVVFACRDSVNLVTQARAGLTVPPQDPEALARALARLANLPWKIRAEMGAAGRAYVEQHLTFDRLALEFERSLRYAVGQGADAVPTPRYRRAV